MDIENIIGSHRRVLFLFSGGKDSVAVYHLVKPYLDRIIVGWVDTGDNAPEVSDYVLRLAETIPNFIHFKSDVRSWIKENGYPSDVVPTDYTKQGQLFSGKKDITIANYLSCCHDNIWLPLGELADHVGADAVITGQRNEDDHKSFVKNGTFDGRRHHYYPIVDWSTEQVVEYIKAQGENAERFSLDHTSIDCLSCTAYCNSQSRRMEYVRKHYPERFIETVSAIKKIQSAIREETQGIDELVLANSFIFEEHDEI